MTLTRKTLLAGGAGAVAILRWFPARGLAAPAAPAAFAPADLQSDLAWLRTTMLDVGVKPFAYCDRDDWEKRYETTLSQLTAPMTVFQYWLAVGPLFASLNDGHAGVSIYDAFKAARDAGLTAFPLLANVSPDGLFVSDQTLEGVPVGTQIVAVDGVTADALTSELLRLTGGQTQALRYAFAGSRLSRYLYARYGERTSYAVSLKLADGSAATKPLAAMGYAHLTAAMKAYAAPSTPNYTFSRLAGGQVGYIDYLRCEDYDAFGTFLRQTCESLKDQPVKGLIVDIRKNGGGNSNLNNELWQWISDKPLAQFGGMTIRVSDRLKQEYGQKKYAEIYGDEAWGKADGTVLTSTNDDTIRGGKDPATYTGPVYLLVGVGTFSSAMECAAAAKDYGLATLVGQETGEPVNSTGEIYQGVSPKVGLSFAFTTKYFLGPKPQPDGQGVVPDVTIVPTAADVRAGRDPVLDYAVKAIVG